MTQALKARSKRCRKVSSSAPHNDACRLDATPFTDTFVREWIDKRLGDAECRPLLLLHVNAAVTSDIDANSLSQFIAKLITDHGGDAIRRRGHQVIGVWGLHTCRSGDQDRIIAAARSISQAAPPDNPTRCVLHAQIVRVAKATDKDAHDAIVVALAALPNDALQSSRMPDTIIVSEAFKNICNLSGGMLPLSFAGAPTHSKARSFYALQPYGPAATQDGVAQRNADALDRAEQIDALGDLKPLIIAAAIVGPVFTPELLARMLDMEKQRLAPAIAAARARGLIDLERSPAGVDRFVFRDAGLQQFAYEMVPAANRLRFHRKIAEALSRSGKEARASPPVQVARHHRFAGNPTQSKRWLGKAAWQAIESGDAGQAVTHLEEALNQGSDPVHTSAFNRSLLQLLGVQLAVTIGNGSDAVFDAYQRSIMVAGEVPHLAWGQEVRSLWLAQSCHLVKGEVRAALTIGSLLLIHLKRHSNRSENSLGSRILIHRMHALALMLSGQLHQALEHYDVVVANYEAKRHAVLRFAYGSDQAALAHAHSAWVHALSGNSNDAALAIGRARRVCDRLDHPHTTAHALAVCALAALTTGAHDEALFAAREARATAVEQRYPYWTAWADVILAAADTQATPRTTYVRLADALSAYQATGAAQLCPFIYAELSAAALRDNRPDVALDKADAGLAVIAHNGCILYRPELMRQRARALFVLKRNDEAEAALAEGFEQAANFGATAFGCSITSDGLTYSSGQHQIDWQRRYHTTV